MKRKPQEIFNSRSVKKSKCSPEEDVAPFLRKQSRRVTLYFNENDELVDEATALQDPKSYYHKYHAVQVDFGTSEGDKITKDIFCGDKCADAKIFIENLQKTKAKRMAMLEGGAEYMESMSDSDDAKMGIFDHKESLNESVILDLNPAKFEKAKDHLFFDFFSLYAKNFIDQRQKPKARAARI